MTNQTATRLTAFAYIAAIEEDVRDYLIATAGPHTHRLLVGDVPARVHKRYVDATGVTPTEADAEHLLDFCDFADLAKALREMIKLGLDRGPEAELALAIERASPARNRICHSRPLEPEDFPAILDLTEQLLASGFIATRRLQDTRARTIADPRWVFGLDIPTYWQDDATPVMHNLPVPEFEETGFLGRKRDRESLRKLLLSAHPVITVIGEGGVGKTALALACLYDLVAEGAAQPFDAIVWVSLKTTALVGGGTTEVRDSVRDVLGLLQQASAALGTPRGIDPAPDILLREVLDYLSNFKILLAIDNLETLAVGDLRELLINLPGGSKILLTSRVPLGEFEVRYTLDRLDEGAASMLLRRYASVLNVASLTKATESDLRRYSNALFGNPLLIRWFVAAVSAGDNPAHLLSGRPSAFDEAVAFCFQNLFDRLSELEQQLLYTIAAARKPLSRGELILLLDRPVPEVEQAIVTLNNSSMVRRPDTTAMQGFTLTPIAATYIERFRSPSSDLVQRVSRNLAAVSRMAQADQVLRAGYEYDQSAFEWKTRDDLIAVSILRIAQAEERQQDYESALRRIAHAAHVAPEFSEVFRVEARLRARMRDLFRAAEAFGRALALAPNSARLHYFYGLFLINDLEDLPLAQRHLAIAEQLDPNHAAVGAALATSLKRAGKYAEAAQKYERLLIVQQSIPKRHRLSNRDQAADCYRRWMERDLEEEDKTLLIIHFERAIEIIKEGAVYGDVDDRLGGRLASVLDLACRAARVMNSSEIAVAVANGIRDWPTQHHHMIEQWAVKSQLGAQFAETWRALTTAEYQATILRDLHTPNDAAVGSQQRTDEEEEGTICSVKAVFGFIQSDRGERLYFSAGQCSRNTFAQLREGLRVAFAIGENKQGRCAVKIRLLPPQGH